MEIKSLETTDIFIQQFGLMYFKHKKDDNKIIVTSPKCGTRYLSNISESNSEFIRFHPGTYTNKENNEYFNNISEIFWIVRDPMEHLISAIITEHQSNMNSMENPNKTSSKLKIKKNDESWKNTVLEILLKDILTEPKFTINIGNNDGGTFNHYSPKYEMLYNEISTRIDLFSKIKFIELKDLSEFIQSEFKLYTNIEIDSYTMDMFFTKDNIIEVMQLNFTDAWNKLKIIIDTEQYYYNKVLKYDYDELFTKKINKAYTELDDIYETLKKLIPSYSNYKVKNIKNNINTIKKQLIINKL
jgi:hypothetical protein